MPSAIHLTTPPHQDHWYTGGTTNLWTVWIALTEIPRELGPLAVLPGSHVNGLRPHAGHGAGRQGVMTIDDGQFAAAPLAAGDAIFFNCLTVHRALANVTQQRVRLSVDYRYQPANEPIHVVRVDGTRASTA
jgi:ectoine hydroxylase-related dioxygenase (phytanoyl-CoA dioxygenase family)